MQLATLLLVSCAAAHAVTTIPHAGAAPSTAFQHSNLGFPKMGRSMGHLPLRSSKPAVSSVSMMASPFNIRQRLGQLLQKCNAGAKGVVTAAAAATCISLAVTTMPKPSFAATAAELAAEIGTEDETEDGVPVEIEYTGMRKLTLTENIIKYSALGGGLGGWLVWTIYEGKKEDREEEERVKKEVERIEQWKKEFIDMDDVIADDEIMDSLSKRMSGETGGEDGDIGEDGSGGLPRGYNPDPPSGSDGGASGASDDTVASIDEAQMERLRRMMGGGDTPSGK